VALTCPTSVQKPSTFEFIDCTTISISYSSRGTANVGFTVVSTSFDGLLNDYSVIEFGKVTFSLVVKDVNVSVIPGTLVYQYQLNMIGFGC